MTTWDGGRNFLCMGLFFQKHPRPGGAPYDTPSFFCRLVDEVVYWNTRRLSGKT